MTYSGLATDVRLPIASKSTLVALVNIRYLWETGAHLEDDGRHSGADGDMSRSQHDAEIAVPRGDSRS